ncbi:MAG: DUF4265 domain-containing protein [Mucilaginibacter sp.]|uniref:DUF4265 domain-containing protein n=1 Tax=Mucilaginibacter sp. TaxID=1882438 RepID=UPI003264423D
MEDNNIKILFRFHSDILDEETVETMWALPVDIEKGLYQIKNIPFYVPSIATEDIVFAEYDSDEERLTYRETIEYSDNSTVRVVIMNDSIQIETVRKLFNELGCPSEKLNRKYFAMEIPENVRYKKIKDILADMEQKEELSYNESCLSDKHREEIE